MNLKISPQLQHITLAVLLVLALAATVALQVAHVAVPPILQLVDSASAGALFGVTVPGAAVGGGTE